jgi:hypothetical protein
MAIAVQADLGPAISTIRLVADKLPTAPDGRTAAECADVLQLALKQLNTIMDELNGGNASEVTS